MTDNQTWYGYTKNEYYSLIWQPGDLHWEDLEESDECPDIPAELKEAAE